MTRCSSTNYAQINLVNQLGSIAGRGRVAARISAGLLHACVGRPGSNV